MKFILKIFFALLPCLALAEVRELEPKLNKFEAGIIKDASAEKDAVARAKIFEQALESDSASAGLFFNAANAFANLENYDKAKRYYDKALEILPSFYLARRNLAYIYFNQKNWIAACENFSKSLELSQEEAKKILPAISQCHFELGRYAEALTSVENALALQSADDENLLKLKALCLRELKDSAKLRDTCTKLISISPRNSLYWRLLAGLNIDQKNYDEAISILEAMRNLKIAEPKDNELLADLYMQQSMFKKACELYLKMPLDSGKAYKIGLVLAYRGMGSEASNFLQNLSKDSAEYWELLATIKIQSSQDARAELEKAYAKNPLNQRIAIMLADAMLENKDFEQAELLYKNSANDYPLESALGLAKILTLKGKYADAASLLRDCAQKLNKPELLKYAEKLENL